MSRKYARTIDGALTEVSIDKSHYNAFSKDHGLS